MAVCPSHRLGSWSLQIPQGSQALLWGPTVILSVYGYLNVVISFYGGPQIPQGLQSLLLGQHLDRSFEDPGKEGCSAL